MRCADGGADCQTPADDSPAPIAPAQCPVTAHVGGRRSEVGGRRSEVGGRTVGIAHLRIKWPRLGSSRKARAATR